MLKDKSHIKTHTDIRPRVKHCDEEFLNYSILLLKYLLPLQGLIVSAILNHCVRKEYVCSTQSPEITSFSGYLARMMLFFIFFV